jgi:hypothetical protein
MRPALIDDSYSCTFGRISTCRTSFGVVSVSVGISFFDWPRFRFVGGFWFFNSMTRLHGVGVGRVAESISDGLMI